MPGRLSSGLPATSTLRKTSVLPSLSFLSVGPKEFMIGKKHYKRTDLDITNDRKQKLKCSYFEPADSERPGKELPCVIYLHGNSSSRVEAVPYVKSLLPSAITLFCFDFAGSGQSDGEYISLGWWERDDVKVIVDYLRKSGKVSTIGLWGRSMGAATALLHADRDPSIAGLVLDSPFTSLTKLAEELYKRYASSVPGFLYSMAQWFVKGTVKTKAKFDINDLNPIDHVSQAFVPALFIVAKDDNFILPAHGLELYSKYAGDKNLIQVDGDHNSPRPPHTITSIYIFFFNTLQVAKLLPGVVEQVEGEMVSKYEHRAHAIPEPMDPSALHAGAPEDDEMEMALKLSLETHQKEEEDRKKGQPEPRPDGKAPPVPQMAAVPIPIPVPATGPEASGAKGEPHPPPVPGPEVPKKP